jgi:prepilin-type N-terminal cleavage/methylation domain-containing protein
MRRARVLTGRPDPDRGVRLAGRRGFTLIELLTVVAILGVLAGLILAAVASARESARRLQCVNNLRQMGLALHSYYASANVFPTSSNGAFHTYSFLTRILPGLEQTALYHAINFGVNTEPSLLAENLTASSVKVAAFVCPSDALSVVTGEPVTNYRCNVGSGVGCVDWELHGEAGPFTMGLYCSLAQIRDGASTTALASEKLIGSGVKGSWDRARDFWYASTHKVPPDPTDAHVAHCAAIAPGETTRHHASGRPWFTDGYATTFYNHAMAPGASAVDCTPYPPPSPQHAGGSPSAGAFAARSHHRSAVHVLTADGACRSVATTVALPVWRAIGTRAGGEVVGEF